MLTIARARCAIQHQFRTLQTAVSLHKQAALAQIYPSEMSSNCCFLASDNIVPRGRIFRDANQQKLEVRYAIAVHRALFIPALPDNGNRIVRQ